MNNYIETDDFKKPFTGRGKSYRITFTLKPSYILKIKNVAEDLDIAMTEFIRRAIDFYVETYERRNYGAYKGVKVMRNKEAVKTIETRRAQGIERLKALSDEEILAYLLEVEYVRPRHESETVPGAFKEHIVEDKCLYEITHHSWLGEQDVPTKMFRMSFEELVADLAKRKKI